MGRRQEAVAEAARKSYIQLLNKLTGCIVTGNIRDCRNICESLHKIICDENEEFLLSMQNDSGNPLFQSNLIIFACKNEQYKVLDYLFNTGEKILLKLYEKIGIDFIHPRFADSFKHNALYYAMRSNNVKLVDFLIEKWPGFDVGKNIECFEDALSISYQDLRLRSVELSSEMEFCVESRLLDFRLALNEKRHNPGVTVPQIIARMDWLISKIHRTLDDDHGNQIEILLQNLKTIAKNIHVLKSLLRSTYDAIPWEEMEFCLATFVRTRSSKDELSILYWSFITRSALMSHLKNFAGCLEAEKLCIVDEHNGNSLKSFPSIERKHAVKMITKKYPFFQTLYHDFERSRDVRSLAVMNEYMNTSLGADPEEKSGRLIIVRTLQVVGQSFQNTFDNPMLTDKARKRLLSEMDGNTRKIIIDIRNSLSNSFVLTKRAEEGDEDTIKFFSGLLTDIRELNMVVKNMTDTGIFQQIKSYFRILVDCDKLDTVSEIMKSFRSIKPGGLAVSGNIQVLQLLIDKLGDKATISLHALYLIDNAKLFLARVQRSILSDQSLAVLEKIMQTWVLNTGFDIINNEYKLERIQSMAKELVDLFSVYKEVNFSRNLGFGLVDFLNVISARLSKDEYYDAYRIVSEIINIIDLLDDNVESNEELHTRLREHNEKFPFDSYEPYPSPEKNKSVKDESMAKRISEIRSIVGVDNCVDKPKSYKLHCREDKGAQLILELLMVETLYFIGTSQDCYKKVRAYVDARVPLLHGPILLDYLIHNTEMDIYFNDRATFVANNARLIASGNVVGNRGYLNVKQAFSDVNALIEQDFHISNVVGFQQQLFQALLDGSIGTFSHCLEHGADILGRNCNNTTALHYAARGPSSEPLKYLLDQWKRKTDVKNLEGVNPLHLAVYNGQVENAELLLTRGKIPVDAPDDFGRTGLHYSVSTEFTNMTNMLLSFKADPNAMDQEGHTPLKQALYSKNIEASKLILEQEKFCYDYKIGSSPLDVAAEKGLSELLPTLIKLEAIATHENRNKKTSTAVKQITPLHYAAKSGHVDCIKILLQNGWDVNVTAFDGDTPLLCGVMSNNEGAVRLILEKGADANDCSSILLAARNGNIKITEMLIAGKASVNKVEPSTGGTPLHWAALHNRRDLVELLVKNGVRVNAKDNNGQTALHYCANRGYCELSKVLMKRGARTNVSDKLGYFPHLYAVLAGNKEILELMVTSTNVNAVESMGYTALHCSCRDGYVDIVRFLLNKGAKVNVKANNKRTPLHIAVMNGFHEIVNLLLEKDAFINDTDCFGSTPLLYAAAFGRTRVIEILIQRGANINQVIPYGYTPLHLACASGSLECASLLIDKGCSVNLKVQDGNTPLRMAVEGNNKSIIELLMKNKAKIDEDSVELAVQSGFGDVLELLLNGSPAHVKKSKLLLTASVKGHLEIIKILVKRGADINGKCTMIGDRPLHGAVSTGDAKIVQVLLDLGANPNVKCAGDITPMHLAARLGHFETAVVLLKHKSKILAKDADGLTSLDFAVDSDRRDIVELFLNHDKTININKYFSTDQHWPLLHAAAQSGKIDVVKLLVEKGADINRKAGTGSKAIHIAAREGFTDIVEFLLSKGMSLYDTDKDENNLLHYLAHGSGDRLKVAKLLVCNKHMELNRLNSDGRTPLHLAVFASEDVQLIKFFMKNGAYYDVKDFRGNAVKEIPSTFPIRLIFHSVLQLLSAAKRGDLSQVRNSIRQGAVLDAKNERNETPLLCATWKGKAEVVNELLAKGANPDLAGKSGSTPMHYASKSSHYTIVMALLGGGAVFEPCNEGNKTPLDYATDEKISKVLKLIHDTFLKIKVGDVEVLKSLRKIKLRPEEVRALVNCRDRNGKTILACAMLSDFPDVKLFQSVFRDNQNLEKADKLLSSGRSREALFIAKLERTRREAMFSDDSMMNAAIDLVIAVSLCEEQRYADALLEQQKLYETCKKMLGEDNELTITSESLKAHLLQKKGEIKRAVKLFESVNERQKSVLSPLHPNLIQTQINMSVGLFVFGKLERALELNHDLVERCKLVHGGDHPITLGVQNNIAKILARKGRYDEALEIHKKVLEKRKNICGAKHRETLHAMIDIGYVYFYQKKFKDSIKIIMDAMKIQSGTLDKFCGGGKGEVMSKLFDLLKQGKMFNIFKDRVDHEYRDEREMRFPGMFNFFERMERSGGRGLFLDDEDDDDFIRSSNLPGNPSNTLADLIKMNILRQLGLINVGRSFRNEGDIFDHLFDSSMMNRFQDIESDEGGDDPIVEERIDKNTAFQAIARGDREIVWKMIDNQIDFNATDEEGRTPLHFAVNSGSAHLVESLIGNGAEVNVKSNKGNTPLHTAALLGREDIAEILLKNVKDAERCSFIDSQTSKSGMTALHIAASKGKLEVVKTLLKNGATFNATSNDHKSPLDLSINEEVTSTLNRLDNVFKTITATINSVKGVSNDDWNGMIVSRNAEGGVLWTEIVKCKDLLDRMVCTLKSSVPKIPKQESENVDKKE